jgi:hypothetical protein
MQELPERSASWPRTRTFESIDGLRGYFHKTNYSAGVFPRAQQNAFTLPPQEEQNIIYINVESFIIIIPQM